MAEACEVDRMRTDPCGDEARSLVQTLNASGSGPAAFRVRLGKYKVELGGRKKTLDIRLSTVDVTI
jgi:hypothetical protein